jgi:hypothetical protein
VLHLRIIAPTRLREAVIELLTGNPGVTHVVFHRDAALDPRGDEITADIASPAPRTRRTAIPPTRSCGMSWLHARVKSRH